jgi:hypothetical protein
MALRTAGAGSTTWTAAAFSGGAATVAADEVVVPTGASLTISAANTVLCRSISVTGTGTLIFAATSSILTIGDATPGTGNVAISVASGATITLTGLGVINLVSTSTTQQTIASGGKTLPSINQTTVNSNYILTANLTQANTSTFTHTGGTWNTGGFAWTLGTYSSSGAVARTLTLGSSLVTLISTNTPFSLAGTNHTQNSGTSTITCNSITNGFGANTGTNNPTYYDVVFTGTANIVGQQATFNSITFNGPVAKTGQITFNSNPTIGTLTINGNSAINRILIASTVRGTTRTLTVTNTPVLSNVDIMDMTAAGASSPWNLSAITGLSGNGGGNSNMTLTTGITQNYSAGTGTWSTMAWPTRVPLPQDNSNITGTGTITGDMPREGKDLDFTGFTGTFTSGANTEHFGSYTLVPGMTYGPVASFNLSGRGSHTVTWAGKTIGGSTLTYIGFGGTYTQQDAFTSTGIVSLNAGTLDTNNQNVTSLTFVCNSGIATSLILGTTTWTLTQTAVATVWNISNALFTLSGASSTIVIGSTSPNTRTIAGGGLVYGTIRYNLTNSSGQLNITGSNTIDTYEMGAGRSIGHTSGTTSTIKNWIGTGTDFGYQLLTNSNTNSITSPDAAPIQFTSSFTVDAKILPGLTGAWSSPSTMCPVSKNNAAINQGWWLRFTGVGGGLNLMVNGVTASSTAGMSSVVADGTPAWVRAVWNDTTNQVSFYWRLLDTDPWTQLGTTVTLSSAGMTNVATPLLIGARTGPSDAFAGRIYRIRLYGDATQTSLAFDANFETKQVGANSFTESSSNAATVTIPGIPTRNGDGRLQISSITPGSLATISKPWAGHVSADYLVMQDIRVTQPLNFWAGLNSIDVSGNTNIYFTTPGTFKHKQSIASTIVGPTITNTFREATTPGNLLICHVTSTGTPTGAPTSTPTGFTLAYGSLSAAALFINTYYKVADGSETTLSYTQTNAGRTLVMTLEEYTGFSGTPTLDVTDGNTGSGTSLSATSGAGPTNTDQPALALALMGANGALSALISATNGFLLDYTPGNTSSTSHAAIKEITTLAPVTTTLTWTTSRTVGLHLVVFKSVAGATSNFFPMFPAI